MALREVAGRDFRIEYHIAFSNAFGHEFVPPCGFGRSVPFEDTLLPYKCPLSILTDVAASVNVSIRKQKASSEFFVSFFVLCVAPQGIDVIIMLFSLPETETRCS
jgi:hypothetical protein